MTRNLPWQIAADLEAAADAVRSAGLAVGAVDSSAIPESGTIIDFLDYHTEIVTALKELSAKYQAIADAEFDEPEKGGEA